MKFSTSKNEVRKLVPTKCTLGESPVWDDFNHLLHWVDIEEGTLHSYNPLTKEHDQQSFKEKLCAVAVKSATVLLLAFEKRVSFFNREEKTLEESCLLEPELENTRANDGKLDPQGRFWIGTMDNEGREGRASLYRLEKNTLFPVLNGISVSNGMAWSKDGRYMYYIDSLDHSVRVFDFDASTGEISNPREAVRVPELLGLPDGMCIAPDGTLWVAHWGLGAVINWNPHDGKLINTLKTACPHTASCAFGVDHQLYITTARIGLTSSELEAYPDSGALLVADLRDQYR